MNDRTRLIALVVVITITTIVTYRYGLPSGIAAALIVGVIGGLAIRAFNKRSESGR